MNKRKLFAVSSISLLFAFSSSVNALEINPNKIKDSILNTKVGITDKSISIGNDESNITLLDDGTNRGVNVKLKDTNIDVGYTPRHKEVKIDNFVGNDVIVSYEKGKHEVKINNDNGKNVSAVHNNDEDIVQINGNNGNSISAFHSEELKEAVIKKDNKEIIQVDTNYNNENAYKKPTIIDSDKHLTIDKDKISVSHKGLVEIIKTKKDSGTSVLLKVWCPLGYRINITKFIDKNGKSKIENIRLSYIK